jgi:hypothetical protein
VFVASSIALVLVAVLTPGSAFASSLTPSNPQPSTNSTYDLTLTASSSTTLRCIRLEFDASPYGTGGIPSGMNLSGATLSNTQTNFVPSPASWSGAVSQSDGTIEYTNSGGQTPNSGVRHIVVDNIVNPTTAGTYSLLLGTYSNSDCSNGLVDSVVISFVVTGGSAVTVNVVPTLTFSVAGRSAACNSQSPSTFSATSTASAVNLGHIDRTTTGGGAQDLTVTTLGPNGFTVSINAPSAPNAMTDGVGHFIADIPGTHAAPGAPPFAGQEGFGYTTDDTLTGFGVNQFAKITAAPESVLRGTPGAPTKSGCVGFQAGASATTAAGAYNATVQYTAVPYY